MNFQRQKSRKIIERVQEKARKNKEDLRNKLTNKGTNDLATQSRRKILDLAITPLLANLKNGSLKPVQVLEAYQVLK